MTQVWLERFNQFLNPKRTAYGLITGGILWLTWLLSIILGPGNKDLANQVIGTDYLQFYAAGMTIRLGESANLYNFEYQAGLEKQIAGSELIGHHAFITPPFFAYLFIPLSYLPYPLSFTFFSLLSLGCLYLCVRWLGAVTINKTALWSTTFFPVFATISFGQNSLLSLFLLTLSYKLWRAQQPFFAGLSCSLLLYKPQLILGVAFLWLLEYRRDWKALAGLLIGLLGLGGLSFFILPEASLSYLNFSTTTMSQMMSWETFPLWHAHTWRAFWYLLLPDHLITAEIFWLIISLVGLLYFIRFWKNQRHNPSLLFSLSICLTLWITPHAMIYDWTLLLIPAIILWETSPHMRPLWKFIFSLVWISVLISGPLVSFQLKILPIAFQISLPTLSIALIMCYKGLTDKHHTAEDLLM